MLRLATMGPLAATAALALSLLAASVGAALTGERGVALGPCRYAHGEDFDYTENGGNSNVGGNGKCYYKQSFGNIFNDEFPHLPLIAPPNTDEDDDWANGVNCGECYEVTGPSGSAVYMVADHNCPSDYATGEPLTDCDPYQWSFSYNDDDDDADELVSTMWSNPQFTFQKVACGVTGNIWLVADPFNQVENGFTTHTPINHRLGITTIELKMSGSDEWTLLEQQGSAQFKDNTRTSLAPAEVKITSILGDVITGTITSFEPDTRTEMDGQFPEPPPQGWDEKCDEYVNSGAIFDGDDLRLWAPKNVNTRNSFSISTCDGDNPSGRANCGQFETSIDECPKCTESSISLMKFWKEGNYHNNGLRLSWYSGLTLTIKVTGGSAAGVEPVVVVEGIAVQLLSHSGELSNYVDVTTVPDVWDTHTISLADFGISASEAEDWWVHEIDLYSEEYGEYTYVYIDDMHWDLTDAGLASTGRIAYQEEEWDSVGYTAPAQEASASNPGTGQGTPADDLNDDDSTTDDSDNSAQLPGTTNNGDPDNDMSGAARTAPAALVMAALAATFALLQ